MKWFDSTSPYTTNIFIFSRISRIADDKRVKRVCPYVAACVCFLSPQVGLPPLKHSGLQGVWCSKISPAEPAVSGKKKKGAPSVLVKSDFKIS